MDGLLEEGWFTAQLTLQHLHHVALSYILVLGATGPTGINFRKGARFNILDDLPDSLLSISSSSPRLLSQIPG
jgi:hypothetical protein